MSKKSQRRRWKRTLAGILADSIRKGCDDGPASYEAYSGVDGRRIVTFTHVGMQQSGNGRTLSGMAF